MSTRDELTKAIDLEVARDENWEPHGGYEVFAVGATERIADALIAEGWRKKPSREEMARAIFELQYHSMHWLDAREPEKDDYRNRADQILALMDRGQ